MSPHAIPQATDEWSGKKALLDSFAVTSNGFLPSHLPLGVLTDPYYSPWELLITQIPQLIQTAAIRHHVDQLPVLDTSKLASVLQWRRAYVILSFICHGYIWAGDKASEILPPSISVPFLQVSAKLEVPPVATYAALNLWNFTSSNKDFTDLDSLHALHTFTGTEDESWFYCVSVAMEAKGAAILPVMLRALDSVKTRDYNTISDALDQMMCCIQETGALLERMYEKCDPNVFFHRIRPFLAGSKNMEKAGLPRGVFYDEGNGNGSWIQLRGGSNGQSSLIQFFDIVLDVQHTSEGNSRPDRSDTVSTAGPGEPKKTSFHQEVRDYMPGPHRRFLEKITRMGSIRNLALLPASTSEQQRLREAYQGAIYELTEFRNKHLQTVTRYIVIPSKQPRMAVKLDLATASANSHVKGTAESESTELTGTGGTALLPFLKQSRDETCCAGQL